MALDAQRRSSIYQKLVPILGDDDANALMSEFPASEADELVTKQFLRAELAITRGELRSEMAQMRDELRGGIAGLRGEIAEVRSEARSGLAALEQRLTLRLGGAMAGQTTVLLAAFGLLS